MTIGGGHLSLGMYKDLFVSPSFLIRTYCKYFQLTLYVLYYIILVALLRFIFEHVLLIYLFCFWSNVINLTAHVLIL